MSIKAVFVLQLVNIWSSVRIHDILVWIRIRTRGSMPLTNINSDPDPDPAFFVIDLQDVNKKLIHLKKCFCLLLFEGTFTSFFKDKKSKRIIK
jgi:hypothetical protein